MTLGRYVLTADVTITWPSVWAELIAGAANVPVTAPSVPSSATAVTNGYPVAVTVAITGGTVTLVQVSGGTVATSSPATAAVPSGSTIAVTYSSAPTWTWTAAELPQSGTSSMTAAVASPAPAGGQAGSPWQTTFLAGTPLWLDNAGLLYAAIGSGNLRAWIDGTDNTGHWHWACLGN